MYLPGWIIQGVTEDADRIVVDADFVLQPNQCSECYGRISSHGSIKRNYVEAPVRGKQVQLRVNRRRYRCENGHTFQQPLDDCMDGKQMTVRALRYIEEQAVRTSLNSISARLGVSDKTVRDVSSDFFLRLANSRIPSSTKRIEILPVVLGSVAGYVLLDRDKGRLLDLVSRRDWQKDAGALLEQACRFDRVETVYDPAGILSGCKYKNLDREVLPTDPRIASALEKTSAVSSKVSFSVARARMHLWSDPLLHADVVQRGFTEQCVSCLASCIMSEIHEVRIRMSGGSKGQDQTHRLCTACNGLRVPVWFRPASDFTREQD